MEKQQTEKFVPSTEAESITVDKFIKSGQGQYGPWYLYRILDSKGVEKSWFLDDDHQGEVSKYIGKSIVVKVEPKMSKAGKPYKELVIVGPAILNSTTGAVVSDTPVSEDPTYWEKEKHLLAQALFTAIQAVDLAVIIYTPVEKDENGEDVPDPVRDAIVDNLKTADVIQKLGTSLYIEYKRRT